MLENYGVTVAWQGSTIEALNAIAIEADKLGFGYFWVPEDLGTGSLLHHFEHTEQNGQDPCRNRHRECAFSLRRPNRNGLRDDGSDCSGSVHARSWFQWKSRDRKLARIRILETSEENGRICAGNKESCRWRARRISGRRSKEYFQIQIVHDTGRSKLEIYLGALGDANLKLAGRICDGAILAMYSISKLDYALKMLNGESRKKLFVYLPTFISHSKDDLAKANQRVAKSVAFYVSSMGSYYSKNLVRLGYEDDVSRILEAHRVGDGAPEKAVSQRLLDELSLIGTSQSVIEKVSKLPEGVIPVLAFGSGSLDEVMGAVEFDEAVETSLTCSVKKSRYKNQIH